MVYGYGIRLQNDAVIGWGRSGKIGFSCSTNFMHDVIRRSPAAGERDIGDGVGSRDAPMAGKYMSDVLVPSEKS